MPQSRYRHGGLPHLDAPGHFQHIVFHLADSLPREALTSIELELAELPHSRRKRAMARRIAALLDAGLGSCLLADPFCARIVADTLIFGHGNRYWLHDWVIMPNHVHVLIRQGEREPLARIIQSWKRHSAREIRRKGADIYRHAGSESAGLWQRDYWDRYIRDERHLAAVKEYIWQNPVAAGLVSSPEDWPYGSAARGDDET
ncbi:transposase [Guyparkeria halophila]|uniref:Transposase n=1 Tax=Guyparkeria halophila TaxID=47960 RepID=A0ABZ0YYU7_9GAMM|nr:transposase [Guyparkeria halophila]WQH17365.1 transposase [Guyparkeria halophila]